MGARNAMLYGKQVNWDDIPWEAVRPGVRRRVYSTDDVMLVMNELSPDMEVRPHSHDDFDQLVTILSGRGRFHVGDDAVVVGPGDLLLVPAKAEHCIEPLPGEDAEVIVNLDLFTPPRADLTPGPLGEGDA